MEVHLKVFVEKTHQIKISCFNLFCCLLFHIIFSPIIYYSFDCLRIIFRTFCMHIHAFVHNFLVVTLLYFAFLLVIIFCRFTFCFYFYFFFFFLARCGCIFVVLDFFAVFVFWIRFRLFAPQM